MTYRELYESATRKLEKSEITLGEYEEMTKSLNEDVRTWIPVSERLPEKKVKDYLACCDNGYIATIMYDNGRWLIDGNNVIAWMPLPEPYKAESEKNEQS